MRGIPTSTGNPIWDVRTGRFDGGWTIEMEIPFKSLRFPQGASQVWGLQFARRIRRKSESTFLTPVPIQSVPGEMRISAAGTLTGVEVPPGSRRFEVKPYAIGSLATDVNAVPLVSNDGDGDVGFDVKYGLTQNLTADVTYNTDFAQVEVDEQQVNLTRFSLFFPEKREFFLESRGTFDFGRGARFGGGGGGRGGTRRPSGGGFSGGGDVPTIFFSRRIGLEQGQDGAAPGRWPPHGQGGQVQPRRTEHPDRQRTERRRTLDQFHGFAGQARTSCGAAPSAGSSPVGRCRQRRRDRMKRMASDAAFSFYENVNFNGYFARTATPGLDGDDASYQGVFTYTGDLYGLPGRPPARGRQLQP